MQEAWLRLARTGGGGIEDLRGWLTTVTGRICLDALRRRGVRGEQPLELEHRDAPAGGGRGLPDRSRRRRPCSADSVGLALYVVMDALTPAERVSFVLHDVFEIPFDAIAAILGRSTAATKMLASRARGRIRLGTPATAADAAAREVVDAFLAAAGRGDLAGLLAVLAPEVEFRAQGPRGRLVVRGAGEVAAPGEDGRAPARRARWPTRCSSTAFLASSSRWTGGRSRSWRSRSPDGAITAIRLLADPHRLAQAVPSWVA